MKKFFTLIAGYILISCIHLSANEIQVNPGDKLAEIIEEAEAGSVIILADGEYEEELTVKITKDVTIKAANSGQAILNKYQFAVPGDITVESILIEGLVSKHEATVDSKYFFAITETGTRIINLTIRNCYIEGYGRGVIRGTTGGVLIENLIIEECTLVDNSRANPGYSQINVQACEINTLKIANTTFYNSPAAILRYDNSGKTGDETIPKTEIIKASIENCTVLNCGSSSGRTMVEISKELPAGSEFIIKDCIFTGTNDENAPTDKPINLNNQGDIINCLLEGYSSNEEKPTEALYKNINNVSLVEASVTDYSFDEFQITTNPSTVREIGDLRWTFNDGPINSIEDNEINKNILQKEYYDISGKKITGQNFKGIIIERIIYDDGSTNTNKIVK